MEALKDILLWPVLALDEIKRSIYNPLRNPLKPPHLVGGLVGGPPFVAAYYLYQGGYPWQYVYGGGGISFMGLKLLLDPDD